MVETMRLMKENEMEPEQLKFSPENLAKLINLAESRVINSSVAKEVFETTIPRNVALSEAPSFGEPAIYYDKKAKGSKAYENLAKEIAKREKKKVAKNKEK